MDTVEWGSDRTPIRPPDDPTGGAPGRSSAGALRAALAGRWRGPAVACGALVALLASEILPWATLHVGSTQTAGDGSNFTTGPDIAASGDTAVSLEQLPTLGVLTYRLGTLVLLALVGAALFGPSRRPRGAVLGAAVGAVASQVLSLAGIIHSFPRLFEVIGGVPTGRLPNGYHTTTGPGAYLAIVGLVLLVVALVMSVVPWPFAAPPGAAVREPPNARLPGAQPAGEPIELTVTQVKPLDDAYYSRPDPYRR